MKRTACSLFVLSIALGGCCGLECTSNRDATLAHARADGSVARGWLPDILPATTTEIKTENNLDLNVSFGAFRFAPGDDLGLLRATVPGADMSAPFVQWEDTVAKRLREGSTVRTYEEDGAVWVFSCRRQAGHCVTTMWLQREPAGHVATP